MRFRYFTTTRPPSINIKFILPYSTWKPHRALSELEFPIGNIYCIIPKERTPLGPTASIIYYEFQTKQKEENW